MSTAEQFPELAFYSSEEQSSSGRHGERRPSQVLASSSSAVVCIVSRVLSHCTKREIERVTTPTSLPQQFNPGSGSSSSAPHATSAGSRSPSILIPQLQEKHDPVQHLLQPVVDTALNGCWFGDSIGDQG